MFRPRRFEGLGVSPNIVGIDRQLHGLPRSMRGAASCETLIRNGNRTIESDEDIVRSSAESNFEIGYKSAKP